MRQQGGRKFVLQIIDNIFTKVHKIVLIWENIKSLVTQGHFYAIEIWRVFEL